MPAHSTKWESIKQVGEYRILEFLDMGGTWAVFKAQDPRGKVVSLKVLDPDLVKRDVIFDRFFRGAQAHSELVHPNIMGSVETGTTLDGYCFHAMEYVQGSNLREIIEKSAGLEEKQAVSIIYGIAQGLELAEALGIVHRNIKPKNILVANDGNPKLGGFELARYAVEDSTITQAGTVLGTPLFTNPEQAGGVSVDFRSDIYSLGATFFFAVVGRPPYEGPNEMVINTMHRKNPVPVPNQENPDVSNQTSRVIQKMMQKEPNDRYQTVASLREDLARIFYGEEPLLGQAPPGDDNEAEGSGTATSIDGLSQVEETFLESVEKLGYLSTTQVSQAREATLNFMNQGHVLFVWDTLLEWQFLGVEHVEYVRQTVLSGVTERQEQIEMVPLAAAQAAPATQEFPVTASPTPNPAAQAAPVTQEFPVVTASSTPAAAEVTQEMLLTSLPQASPSQSSDSHGVTDAVGYRQNKMLVFWIGSFGVLAGLCAFLAGEMSLLWAGTGLLIAFTFVASIVWLMLTISAFKESTLWGLGSLLLVPFVVIIFLFKRYSGNRVRMTWILFSPVFASPVAGILVLAHYKGVTFEKQKPTPVRMNKPSVPVKKDKPVDNSEIISEVMAEKRRHQERVRQKSENQATVPETIGGPPSPPPPGVPP